MAHLSIVIEKQMLPNKIFHIDLFISARKHKTTLIFPAAKKCRAGQDFSSACGENLLWLVANLKIRMRNIKDFVSPLKVRKLLLKGFIKRHTLNTFFGTDKGNFRPNLEWCFSSLRHSSIISSCDKPGYIATNLAFWVFRCSLFSLVDIKRHLTPCRCRAASGRQPSG